MEHPHANSNLLTKEMSDVLFKVQYDCGHTAGRWISQGRVQLIGTTLSTKGEKVLTCLGQLIRKGLYLAHPRIRFFGIGCLKLANPLGLNGSGCFGLQDHMGPKGLEGASKIFEGRSFLSNGVSGAPLGG